MQLACPLYTSSVLGRQILHTSRNPTRELNLIVERWETLYKLKFLTVWFSRVFVTFSNASSSSGVFTNMILFPSYSSTNYVTVVDCFCIIIFCTDPILHVLQMYMIWYIKLSSLYFASVTCLSPTDTSIGP